MTVEHTDTGHTDSGAQIHLEDSKRLQEIARCNEELEKLQEISKQYEHNYNRISFARLAVFLIVIAGLILVILKYWWAVIIVLAAAGAFAWLVVLHSRLEQNQARMQNRMRVLREWSASGGLCWDSLSENGSAYLEEKNYVAKDLDIFGPHSLYQMLCRAHTEEGKRLLADALLRAERAEFDENEIVKNQKAIAELLEHREFRLQYETLAMEQESLEKAKNKGNVTSEKEAASENGELSETETASETVIATGKVSPAVTLIAIAIPVLFVGSLIGVAVQELPPASILIVYFTGLFLSFILSVYCNRYLEPVFGKQQLLRSNLALIECLTAESFESERLLELQNRIVDHTEQDVMHGMRRLEQLLSVYHLRHNPIIHFLLGGITLYDVHLARAAVTWRRTYEEPIRNALQVLAEVELLNSFASFASVQECCYPVIGREKTPMLRIENGYHPFLVTGTPVKNSITLDARPRIITGSNMSGKTTFLRTIGINVILAYAGAPVCAEYMELSVMRPFTSMRVIDDVNHGISTFYAEILRIKEMVEYGECGEPMLCLIDEIFKGTNSADRVVGAEAVIRRLTGASILPIISTHDFELCDLAENYHFEEFYDEEGIHFDYKLKNGRCQTTNALYLLKLAGLN